MMTSLLLFALCLTEPNFAPSDAAQEQLYRGYAPDAAGLAVDRSNPRSGWGFDGFHLFVHPTGLASAPRAVGDLNSFYFGGPKAVQVQSFATSQGRAGTWDRVAFSPARLAKTRAKTRAKTGAKTGSKSWSNNRASSRVNRGFESQAQPSATRKPKKAVTKAGAKKSAAKKTVTKGPKKPAKASALLARVQNFFAQAQDLQANFKQTYYKASLSVLAHSKGVLKIKKPKRMFWDYAGTAQDIYSNGQEVWFVEHDTRQVVSSTLSAKDNVNVGLRFLFGDKALLRDYLVRYASGSKLKRYGDAQHWVLQLKPRRRSPHFKGLILVVDKQSSRVDRFVVYNHDGASNYFELSNLKTNTGIPDAVFQKKIPKGYVETKE